MEELSRFDVAEYKGVFMVVIESDLLPPDPAVVVVPLLSNYPAVKYLNPVLVHESKRLGSCNPPDCSRATVEFATSREYQGSK
ncbi:hypothetical protein J7444_23765 [Labrenzia sp. R4_1]|uniref:hypothetical protein n=1 Tax=Labrenzia sp. R4_1 TaxID=2821106 RepID=UPI001ADD1EE1|nr:hypothetical protein [Labrenzia sp. R4_1]MBO9427776.1 hypothetical protein [Labrenzia sp. R4_1]